MEIEYLIPKKIRDISRDRYSITRVSLGLFLDRSISQIEGIEAPLKEAVGFDATRGDTFHKQVMDFSTPPPPETGEVVSSAPRKWIVDSLPYVFALSALGMLALFMRLVIRRSTSLRGSREVETAGGESGDSPPPVEAFNRFVRDNENAVRMLIGHWLREPGNGRRK